MKPFNRTVLDVPELLFKILCLLTPRQLMVLRNVSRQWRRAIHEPILWKRQFSYYFREKAQLLAAEPFQDHNYFTTLREEATRAIARCLQRQDLNTIVRYLYQIPLTFNDLIPPVTLVNEDGHTTEITLLPALLTTRDPWILGFINLLALEDYLSPNGQLVDQAYPSLPLELTDSNVKPNAAPNVLAMAARANLTGCVPYLLQRHRFNQSTLAYAAVEALEGEREYKHVLEDHTVEQLFSSISDPETLHKMFHDFLVRDNLLALHCLLNFTAFELKGSWKSPLFVALSKRSINVATLILRHCKASLPEIAETALAQEKPSIVETLLHVAFKERNIELLIALFRAGLSPTAVYSEQQTLLHIAAEHPEKANPSLDDEVTLLDMIRYAIDKGADLYARNNQGNAVLHVLVEELHSLEIIEYVANESGLTNPLNHLHRTPLFEAVGMRNVDRVRTLLDLGAFVEVRSHTLQTPVSCALQDVIEHRGNTERNRAIRTKLHAILRLLFNIDPEHARVSLEPFIVVEEHDCLVSLWFYACLVAEGVAMLQQLIEAQVHREIDISCAIGIAVIERGRADVVAVLLQANLMTARVRARLHYSLFLLIQREHFAVLHLLVENDVSIWEPPRSQEELIATVPRLRMLCQKSPETAGCLLRQAARRDKWENIQKLIQAGVDVTLCDEHGHSALALALMRGKVYAALNLIRHTPRNDGWSPLINCPNTTLVTILIEMIGSDARFNAPDRLVLVSLFQQGLSIHYAEDKIMHNILSEALLQTDDTVAKFDDLLNFIRSLLLLGANPKQGLQDSELFQSILTKYREHDGSFKADGILKAEVRHNLTRLVSLLCQHGVRPSAEHPQLGAVLELLGMKRPEDQAGAHARRLARWTQPTSRAPMAPDAGAETPSEPSPNHSHKPSPR